MFLGNNAYFNGTNWIGTTTSYAQQMFFDGSGNMTFRNNSVTAGVASGFNNIMVLNHNTRNGYIDTNGNTIYSFSGYGGNVNAGASWSMTISQVLYEFQTSYMVDCVGFYAPGGVNIAAYATGIIHFTADGSTSSAQYANITSNGISISVSATNAGVYTVTFTNTAGSSQSNNNARIIKLNRMN
jgi:hypothetical protein